MTDLNKLCIEIDQFGGNPWTQFTAVDHGWEAIMLRGVAISDRQFVEVLSRFPEAPIDQGVVAELTKRGIWQDDQEPTPKETTIAETPRPEVTPEQPTCTMSEAERRTRRLHAAADREQARALKTRRGR